LQDPIICSMASGDLQPSRCSLEMENWAFFLIMFISLPSIRIISSLYKLSLLVLLNLVWYFYSQTNSLYLNEKAEHFNTIFQTITQLKYNQVKIDQKCLNQFKATLELEKGENCRITSLFQSEGKTLKWINCLSRTSKNISSSCVYLRKTLL